MNIDAKIYVAGHRGLVGSAIMRKLLDEGIPISRRGATGNSISPTRPQCAGFSRLKDRNTFFWPRRVSEGFLANETFPADFIHENLVIQSNVINAAYRHGAAKLLSRLFLYLSQDGFSAD